MPLHDISRPTTSVAVVLPRGDSSQVLDPDFIVRPAAPESTLPVQHVHDQELRVPGSPVVQSLDAAANTLLGTWPANKGLTIIRVMSDAAKLAGNHVAQATGAVAEVVKGCFTTTADQTGPEVVVFTVGEPVELTVTVTDKDGDEVPNAVPSEVVAEGIALNYDNRV